MALDRVPVGAACPGGYCRSRGSGPGQRVAGCNANAFEAEIESQDRLDIGHQLRQQQAFCLLRMSRHQAEPVRLDTEETPRAAPPFFER